MSNTLVVREKRPCLTCQTGTDHTITEWYADKWAADHIEDVIVCDGCGAETVIRDD